MWKFSSGGASLLSMLEESRPGSTLGDGRYRALLDVSRAMVAQPTVKAVLHSLRDVLSNSIRLHGADLYLLDSDPCTLTDSRLQSHKAILGFNFRFNVPPKITRFERTTSALLLLHNLASLSDNNFGLP